MCNKKHLERTLLGTTPKGVKYVFLWIGKLSGASVHNSDCEKGFYVVNNSRVIYHELKSSYLHV